MKKDFSKIGVIWDRVHTQMTEANFRTFSAL